MHGEDKSYWVKLRPPWHRRELKESREGFAHQNGIQRTKERRYK